MNKTDHKRLIETVVGMYDLYGKEASEFALTTWVHALENCDIDPVCAAFMAHVRDPEAGRFLPRPADIIGRMQARTEDMGQVLWHSVLTHARAGNGACPLPEAGRRALEAIGGMSVVRRANESENGFLQKRFCDSFQAFTRHEVVEQVNVRIERTPQEKLQ